MKSTEENGLTIVVIKRGRHFKLHQPAEGPRKGQWLIFGHFPIAGRAPVSRSAASSTGPIIGLLILAGCSDSGLA